MLTQEEIAFIALLDGDRKQLINHKNVHNKTRYYDFAAFMDDYISSNGLKRSHIQQKANLSRCAYSYLNGHKPIRNRNVLLRICISTRMSIEETQDALRYCDLRLLDNEIYRDKIIITGIRAKRTWEDIDAWLYKAEEPSIADNCP